MPRCARAPCKRWRVRHSAATRPGAHSSSYLQVCSSDLEHGVSPQVQSELPEDADMAVDIQTDKALVDVIMDTELDKWAPGSWHQR